MKKQAIISKIKAMSSDQLVELNNLLVEDANWTDNGIYSNDEEFFETFFIKSSEAVRACHFGDYRWNDNLVKFNGYGNLDSFNLMTVDKLPDLVENVVDIVIDNFENYEHLF